MPLATAPSKALEPSRLVLMASKSSLAPAYRNFHIVPLADSRYLHPSGGIAPRASWRSQGTSLTPSTNPILCSQSCALFARFVRSLPLRFYKGDVVFDFLSVPSTTASVCSDGETQSGLVCVGGEWLSLDPYTVLSSQGST